MLRRPSCSLRANAGISQRHCPQFLGINWVHRAPAGAGSGAGSGARRQRKSAIVRSKGRGQGNGRLQPSSCWARRDHRLAAGEGRSCGHRAKAPGEVQRR